MAAIISADIQVKILSIMRWFRDPPARGARNVRGHLATQTGKLRDEANFPRVRGLRRPGLAPGEFPSASMALAIAFAAECAAFAS